MLTEAQTKLPPGMNHSKMKRKKRRAVAWRAQGRAVRRGIKRRNVLRRLISKLPSLQWNRSSVLM